MRATALVPLAAVRFLNRGVEDANAGPPDVRAGAVAFDERDDRIIRHDETTVPKRNRGARGGRMQGREVGHKLMMPS